MNGKTGRYWELHLASAHSQALVNSRLCWFKHHWAARNIAGSLMSQPHHSEEQQLEYNCQPLFGQRLAVSLGQSDCFGQ